MGPWLGTALLWAAVQAQPQAPAGPDGIVPFEYVLLLDGRYTLGARAEMVRGVGRNVSVLSRRGLLSDVLHVEVSSEEVVGSLLALARVRASVPQRRVLRRPLARPSHSPPRTLPQGLLPQQITSLLGAPDLWNQGYRGDGVKVAVLDTGLAEGHAHFRHVDERMDWTDEQSSDDGLGHGTFVAGLIAGSGSGCLGFAPNARLHIYKVFTSQQVSYTSWFLDAFNYAMERGVDLVNLSIGGPDFTDGPFGDKVRELTASGALLISAIGNDGPLYGSLNNPADQTEVLGVGGIDYADRIAKFSSRGMTTWELPQGYGRLKPDLVTYGWEVAGSGLGGGCRQLSGTSVAAPVVTGALALLLSAQPRDARLSPAALKQSLMASADRLTTAANQFEQGWGKMNLLAAHRLLSAYTPQASLSPAYLDMSECPYQWPHCAQPLFHTAAPLLLNVSILNGLHVLAGEWVEGEVETRPTWHPYAEEDGDALDVAADFPERLWPHSGWLALSISLNRDLQGTAAGEVRLAVGSVGGGGRRSELRFPIRVRAVHRPPRAKRLLWDQFHSLRYPPGYLPRDDLSAKKDPLDWHGDHIHTNFKPLFQRLRSQGYFIDVAGEPWWCASLGLYGALLVVDPEEEFFRAEAEALKDAVLRHRLGLVVAADWFNVSVMHKIRFMDDNSRRLWRPETGGSNVAGLNRLLRPFNVSLCDRVFAGSFPLAGHTLDFASGASVASTDAGARLLSARLRDQGHELLATAKGERAAEEDVDVLVLAGGGRLAVYGDSSCLDAAHTTRECWWLLEAVLEYVTEGRLAPALDRSLRPNSHPTTCRVAAAYSESFAAASRVVGSVTADGEAGAEKARPSCRRLRKLTPRPLRNFSSPADWPSAFARLQQVEGRTGRGEVGRGGAGREPLGLAGDPPRRPAERPWASAALGWAAEGGIARVSAKASVLLLLLALFCLKWGPRRAGSVWRRLWRRLRRRLRPTDVVRPL